MYEDQSKLNTQSGILGAAARVPRPQDFDREVQAKLAAAQQEYGNANSAQRQPEIHGCMHLLESAIGRLVERAHELNSRLSPLMRQLPPDADARLKAEQISQTAFGQALHGYREQVDHADQLLMQILQTLEI